MQSLQTQVTQLYFNRLRFAQFSLLGPTETDIEASHQIPENMVDAFEDTMARNLTYLVDALDHESVARNWCKVS